ncbi:MAG: GNAT family N-acetyltransferase [Acidimicrobiia bacterium]|nr:GNAT family N-acetyltransferase [Acidimicrobiia bacterium]
MRRMRSPHPVPEPASIVRAVTRHGLEIDLRPVTPDDKPLLADGFARLSERARYLRFLAPADRLTPAQLAYLSEVDHHDHVAWGALDGGAAAGVARFVRYQDEPSSADVAITVLDAYQGRGVGRTLLEVLGVSARARGISQFHFDVLSENAAMLGLLSSFGATRTDEGEVVHLVADVARFPAPTIVEGDLVGLLEFASRQASAGSSSKLSELTQ